MLGAAALGARDASAQPAHAVSDHDAKRAKDLFKQSEKSYREGRVEEAVGFLKEAYALDPRPVILYNLARAYEALGNVKDAIDAYKRYLDADPKAPDRGGLEQRIGSLERQQREKEELERKRATPLPATSASAQPTAPPPPPPKRASPVPWVVAGLGLAGVGAGLALGATAKSKHDAASAENGGLAASELQSSANSLALGANIALIAGGVIAGAGVVWGIVDLSQSGPSRPKVQARLAPGGVVVKGSF